MKSVRGLARLNTRLHLMVSATPILYELFPLDSSINKTVYHLLGIFLLMVVYSLFLDSYLHQEQTGLRHIHQFQAVINKKESTEIADAS